MMIREKKMIDEETAARLMDIEMAIANQQKALDDLSDVVIKQGKVIDELLRQNETLRGLISQDVVKPLDEETPPPHY